MKKKYNIIREKNFQYFRENRNKDLISLMSESNRKYYCDLLGTSLTITQKKLKEFFK
jgi:protein associated with RNAse G/E